MRGDPVTWPIPAYPAYPHDLHLDVHIHTYTYTYTGIMYVNMYVDR